MTIWCAICLIKSFEKKLEKIWKLWSKALKLLIKLIFAIKWKIIIIIYFNVFFFQLISNFLFAAVVWFFEAASVELTVMSSVWEGCWKHSNLEMKTKWLAKSCGYLKFKRIKRFFKMHWETEELHFIHVFLFSLWINKNCVIIFHV